jgi:plastocyanin
MRTTRTILVVLTASALMLGACGGDDDEGGESNGGGGSEGGGSGGAIELVASGTAFEPTSLSGPAGDMEVSFTNEDGVTHTFTIDDLDVDLQVDGGNSDSVSFTAEAGTYEYRCTIHSQMTGELTAE